MGGAVENFALFGDQTGDWVSTIPRGIRRSFRPKDGGINPLGASGKGDTSGEPSQDRNREFRLPAHGLGQTQPDDASTPTLRRLGRVPSDS